MTTDPMMNMEGRRSIVEVKFYGGHSHGETVTIPSDTPHVKMVHYRADGGTELEIYRRQDLRGRSIYTASGFSLYKSHYALHVVPYKMDGDERELWLCECTARYTMRMLMEVTAAGGWPVEWWFSDAILHNRYHPIGVPQTEGVTTYRDVPICTPPGMGDEIVLISVRPDQQHHGGDDGK